MTPAAPSPVVRHTFVESELAPVYKQLDYLANRFGQMEEAMIDPVEYGELKGAVSTLTKRVDAIDTKLDVVLERLSEARGGWKTLMLLGGAGAALGCAISWFLTHTIHITPKP